MSSSGKYLFNTVQTPQNDRENFQRAHASKNNAEFGRMHLRPKQAFGDLQNVLHNTPLKGPLKRQACVQSPFVTKKLTKAPPPVQKLAAKNETPEDLDSAWLEDSLMSVFDFKAKLQRGIEHEKKQKEDEWKKLEKELSQIHYKRPGKEMLDKYKSSDHLNDILTELCVVEPSQLSPPSIPDLPADDFDTDDFFKW